MKKNRFFTGVMCTLAVVALSACGQEAQEQLQYVSLSQAGCTFFGTDNEPLAVTVETSPAQWAAEASAFWVKAEPGEDGTTLVLSVEDNDGDAERKAAVTVTANAFLIEQQQALAAGCNDIIAKPYTYERLKETIIKYI